ncbi:radical SAM protein [Campylobacter sp. RM12327]|uniref:radical SAM protein n=1 Tax=Campylobacter sputorum TaxID=206 RepID=UPI000B789C21|nr:MULTISPECIES: radical SAM protein [Campylobacter]ASM39405.1 putative coproporphyrinogen III oxidase [Campylobacter sputorum]MBF6669553.1 radical SAM protein [Campylobacter sp. RM12327]MBF6674262.1 radical SAM protein [Campylobacter sp. RM13538]MBF6676046.1 radical SAM protein [Campylobacter sp. RM12321]MBF6678005.1 radical SAM protein [Campylobacter sp. RM11259]
MFNKRIKGHHRGKFGKPIMADEKEFENFLNTQSKDENAILYFHIPFCDNICSFCNLNRSKLDGELEEYTEFLINSIKHYAKFPYIKGKNFKSIYFGGGTPTILKESQLERVLIAINTNFHIDKNAEFSSESTLHNLNLNKLKLMQNFGINRYSIGIQTFSNKGRKLLNRVGDKNSAIKKLSQIKQNFSGLVCTDIIYNYPNQSLEDVIEDAKILKDLEIDSSSFYSLQFHEGSAFLKQNDPNYYHLETDKMLHNAFLEEMLKGDYEVLEYTKINKINRDRYLYIRLSHKGVDILPIGIGAGGRLGNYSIFNMKKDIKMISKTNEVELNFAKFSALFQYDNINLNLIKSYLDDETFEKEFNFFKECESFGYLKIDEGYLKFNIDGIFWGNTIASKAIGIANEYFKNYENKGKI